MGQLADWSVEQYNATRDRIRSTNLKRMTGERGPREYYFHCVEPDLPAALLDAMYPNGRPLPPASNPSIDMILGTLFHDWVLRNRIGWFVCDARANSTEGRIAIRKNVGKIKLSKREEDKLHGWREAIDREPAAVDILAAGMAEQTFLWEDATGLPCMARMDLWKAETGHKVDIKTDRAKTRDEFDRHAQSLGYYKSAAFYTMGEAEVPGFEDAWVRNAFDHLVICKEYPYAAYVFPVASEWMNIGRRQCREALDHLANCQAKMTAVLQEIERVAVEDLPSRGLEIKRAILGCWPDWIAQDQQDPISPSVWNVEALAFKRITYPVPGFTA